jgi:hypothetical protein
VLPFVEDLNLINCLSLRVGPFGRNRHELPIVEMTCVVVMTTLPDFFCVAWTVFALMRFSEIKSESAGSRYGFVLSS